MISVRISLLILFFHIFSFSALAEKSSTSGSVDISAKVDTLAALARLCVLGLNTVGTKELRGENCQQFIKNSEGKYLKSIKLEIDGMLNSAKISKKCVYISLIKEIQNSSKCTDRQFFDNTKYCTSARNEMMTCTMVHLYNKGLSSIRVASKRVDAVRLLE